MDTMLSSVESTKIKSPSWMDSMLSNIENISKNLTTYVVKSGDTLSKIAAKYDKTVTVDSIKKLNGLKSDSISAGQKLKIK
jgi:peptidoglycan endopeptidase LytE